ncbi:cysteine ABC transporter permease/ATP-binding protein [Planococcus antarcticus DSM 14505]|uniref:Cysteine ABC transporter permease/ATP-binding protein n=1 Tax=Planococcus antarcticus DSM 14505 TaxID=1185653 RepID=A0AA87IKZ3_9BACL|nr:thiol reductant ABC exporter subunit CydC [Planococcus antarcticus]EIM06561.1 cysteine ABC transporter permease/ATP-binding protein [Planococcus antarcticus DSM 14505]
MNELKHVLKLTLIEKKDVSIAIFFGFIAGVAGVALMGSSGYLISKAALTSQMTTLVVMAACLKLFGFVSALSRYGERLYSHRTTFTMLSHLRVSFFERLAPLAPGIFGKYRSGDLLARIVGDVESLQNFLLRVFYPPVVLGIVFLSTIFFSSFFSMGIAAVMFIGMLLTVVAVPAIFSIRKRRTDGQGRAKRGSLAIEATEFLYGFRDLKIHQQLSVKEQQLATDAAQYNEGQRKEGLEENLAQSINSFVALLVSFFVLGVGAYFVAAGELNGLYLAMLVMISIAAFENVAPMAAFPAYFEESRKAAVRLEEIVTEPVAPRGTEQLADGPLDIKLTGASFSYPGEKSLAVDNVSIHLKPGTKTAIVGPSGSGKSTLMQLLLNVFPLDQGQLSIGGNPIGTLDQEAIWQKMNVVLQENHFFYGTIRSNLMIADAAASDEQLQKALAKVQLELFPLTMTVEEKGQNLSGGQKQRLAIARALLKAKSLWLLDEPVSSVDNLTGQAIYQELFRQGKGDLFVIISHDLAGLEKMDQIVVMENGQIVESGSYKELMERKSYFYQLKQIENSVFA